jgi:hypothetical protein
VAGFHRLNTLGEPFLRKSVTRTAPVGKCLWYTANDRSILVLLWLERGQTMDRVGNLRHLILFGFLMAVAGILLAQDTPQTSPPNTPKTLVVNGKPLGVAIRQIDGRSYIDIETLAEVTNGTVTIEANRILLTLPGSGASASTNVNVIPVIPPPPTGLSRGFASTAIAALAEMREWRGAVGTMITYGLAVSPAWAQDYHDRAEETLMQASLTATTDSDHDAVELLRNEFDKLAGWSSDVIAARQNFNGAKTVDPNALQNDPVLAKITDCNRFLNSMLVSGSYADDASCH